MFSCFHFQDPTFSSLHGAEKSYAPWQEHKDELALGVGGAVVLGLGLAVDIPEVQRRGGGLGVVRFPPIHVIVGTSETSEEGLKCFCESGDKGFLRYSHCFQRAKLHALRLEAEVTHLGYFVLSCLIGALEAKSNIWPRLKTRPAVWKS